MRKLYLLPIFCISLLVASCGTQKNSLTYFKNVNSDSTRTIDNKKYEIKIVPDDELLITVTSLVPEATIAYNLPLDNPALRGNLKVQTQPTQQTYIVNKDGYINFPVLGKIKVEAKTTTQITDFITQKVSEAVTDPYVRVELLNFKINVLGEVRNPGPIRIDGQRFSILDAIANAGDLTEFGQRENILLIREENGTKTYHRLNINDNSIITSPYFYLQQNDVIYIEPNKIKNDNSKYNQNNAFKLSVVATIVSAVSVIASLVIALAIK